MEFRRSKAILQKAMGKSREGMKHLQRKRKVGTGCFGYESLLEKSESSGLPAGVLVAELPGWFLWFVCIFDCAGLCCCAAFYCKGEQGFLLTAVCRLLIAGGLSCGAWALGQAGFVVVLGLSSCSPRL